MSNNYRQLCQDKGVKTAQVSRDTGIPLSTLNSWANGKRPTLKDKHAITLADYFGVSIDYLMGREDIKKETAQMDDLKREVFNLFDALPVERQALAVEYLRFLRSRGSSET
jgi:transcriptional regulator with XRE-family HTH domain